MSVWLYESGKGDPIAFHSWDDAIAVVLRRAGHKTMDEFIAECEQWDVNVEYEEGVYLSVDDGPRVSEIELR
jgi:hypothetical protein